MNRLNPEQSAAVDYTDGPLLVLAGAGSGKTRVITQKIVHLVDHKNIKAHHITAVTFTNKAAREMKERASSLVTDDSLRGLKVSTFHTLGLRILKIEHNLVNYGKNFSIYDANDAEMIIKESARQYDRNLLDLVKQIQAQISHWKNAMLTPQQALNRAEKDLERAFAEVYAIYIDHMRTLNAVDFDDLISLPVTLFSENEACRVRWQKRIQYLLVDEYQDTNTSQYSLIKFLVGGRGCLTVVGDDDQSIYAWRGAQPENMKLLTEDFPGLKVIKLEQNYRSMGRILKAANQVIGNNHHIFEKSLWSAHGYGDPIRVVVTRDPEHEVEKLATLLLAHKFQFKTQFSDYAILYRGNHQSRLYEKALREHQIPYQLSGGMSFFDFAEIRDVMAYLKVIANPRDDASVLRIINVPRREIGQKTIQHLRDYASAHQLPMLNAAEHADQIPELSKRQQTNLKQFASWMNTMHHKAETTPIGSLIDMVLADVNYDVWIDEHSDSERQIERKQENLHDFKQWLTGIENREEDDPALAGILGKAALIDMLDKHSEEEDESSVKMMTLHASKGLEFPHVFIAGMEEEILPHISSIETDDIEEERRLCYVGITRAQQTLTFLLTKRRRRYGEIIRREPSRFLAEIPEEDLVWEGVGHEVDPDEEKARGKAHLANLKSLLGN